MSSHIENDYIFISFFRLKFLCTLFEYMRTKVLILSLSLPCSLLLSFFLCVNVSVCSVVSHRVELLNSRKYYIIALVFTWNAFYEWRSYSYKKYGPLQKSCAQSLSSNNKNQQHFQVLLQLKINQNSCVRQHCLEVSLILWLYIMRTFL